MMRALLVLCPLTCCEWPKQMGQRVDSKGSELHYGLMTDWPKRTSHGSSMGPCLQQNPPRRPERVPVNSTFKMGLKSPLTRQST